MLTRVKQEFASYSKKERLFIFFAVLCGFFTTFQYGIVKPISTSTFIGSYSVDYFPFAWVAILPLNFLLVGIYNTYLSSVGCFRMFLGFNIASAILFLISGIYIDHIRFLSFFLYLWKDIFVLLLFQQIWSIIHSKISMKRAKYLYGIMFGLGGLGSILGSMIPGLFAISYGSQKLLFLTIPALGILSVCYYFMLRTSEIDERSVINTVPKEKGSLSLLFNSKYVLFILFIVVSMQLTATIVEYQFNTHMQQHIPLLDPRTQAFGKIYGMISSIKTMLQLAGTFLLVHFLGLQRTHIAIPFLLLANAVTAFLFPAFRMVTFSFATIKSFDYSLFNIAKEMLYIPLSKDEKFKAKAIIDVFAYRSSKALASILVLGIQIFIPNYHDRFLSFSPCVILGLWLLVATLWMRGSRSNLHAKAT